MRDTLLALVQHCENQSRQLSTDEDICLSFDFSENQ
jgi:hypothetical protein